MTEFTRRVKVMMYYQDKMDSLNNSLIQNYSEDTATKLSQTKQTLVRQRSKVRKMIHENLNITKLK